MANRRLTINDYRVYVCLRSLNGQCHVSRRGQSFLYRYYIFMGHHVIKLGRRRMPGIHLRRRSFNFLSHLRKKLFLPALAQMGVLPKLNTGIPFKAKSISRHAKSGRRLTRASLAFSQTHTHTHLPINSLPPSRMWEEEVINHHRGEKVICETELETRRKGVKALSI